MNRKTIWRMLLLLLGIGGAMVYLQTNEADKIEQTVLRVEAEKAVQFTARDFDIAAYVMYYKDAAFYTAEEARFYSKLDMIGRQLVMQYMHEQKEQLSEEERRMYKQQAQEEVAYELEKEVYEAFYHTLLQELNVTKEDYIAYVYKKRLSDAMYERLSREQSALTVEEDAFFQFWRSELHTYELNEQLIDDTLTQIEEKSELASPQPNWLITEDGQALVMQYKDTKERYMRSHAMYDLLSFEAYSPMMYYMERSLNVPITRSTLARAIDALQAYEPTNEEQRAYEDMQQIFDMYAAHNEPFE